MSRVDPDVWRTEEVELLGYLSGFLGEGWRMFQMAGESWKDREYQRAT